MEKKRIRLAAVLAASLLLLSGCLFRPPDELYRRPVKSPGYDQLTAAIQTVRAGLEAEFSTPCEDAVIVSGDNTASIQLQDLDGDNVRESAVVFLRVPGVEKSIKILVFSLVDGAYQVTGVVEEDGASIYSVDYTDLNGMGYKELVVSWQISTGVYQLGAYTLDELSTLSAPPVLVQNAGGQPQLDLTKLRATELLLTGCSTASGTASSYARGYALVDIDQDSRTEIAVVRLDSAGANSGVEVYGWQEGAFVSLDQVRLSAGAVSLNRLRANYLGGTYYPTAVYVTCTLSDGSRATDVLAYQDSPEGRRLTNLALEEETGVSRNHLQNNMDISLTDVNSDLVLELPSPTPLPAYGDAAGTSNFWLIDWGQYDEDGSYRPVMTTYHNSADGWYLIIPESWRDRITISRSDTLTGQRQVDFSLWRGEEEPPETFLSIFQLTGSNRTIRAASGGRFTLKEEGETIYAARFYDIGWDCGLDEESILGAFQLIHASWYN